MALHCETCQVCRLRPYLRMCTPSYAGAAEMAGKSLQEYLLGRLIEEARRPSLDDLLDRAGRHKGGHVSFRFASEAVREDRDAG